MREGKGYRDTYFVVPEKLLATKLTTWVDFHTSVKAILF